MSSYLPRLAVALGLTISLAAVAPACGSRGGNTFDDGDGGGGRLDPDGSFGPGKLPDGGDPYANDLPPPLCPAPNTAACCASPDPPKPPIGGTTQCPDDKHKPGCGCTNPGETAPCFTGLRANRGLGVCKDGTTTCQRTTETTTAWGECVGQVLPTAGATKGPQACKCFSAGQWKLANLSPCFLAYCKVAGNPCPAGQDDGPYAVSTVIEPGTGKSKCPEQADVGGPPPNKPSSIWTTDTLKVDCAGHFTLCFELKAGDYANPQAGDCSLVKKCVEADYPKENVEQALPDLGAWSSPDQACAKKFLASGGYGEMSVVGESVRCDKVDDGAGNPYVFNRAKYCPFKCPTDGSSSDPDCQGCRQGGDGNF